MNLKELINEIRKLKKDRVIFAKAHKEYLKRTDTSGMLSAISFNADLTKIDSKIEGIKQTIEAIESLCDNDDGIEVYENRHEEGKGDGVWVNAKDLIKLKQELNSL